jgi:hypothetical protein
MPIESSVTVISDLNATYPENTDSIPIGANHIRNVKTAVLNSAQMCLADYTALRAHTGANGIKSIYITGYLVSAAPSGIAGEFTRDDSDTTSADNAGTIIVDASNRRWKRIFSGNIRAGWFGFLQSATAAANRTALQAAINVAKVVRETILADKYVITTADVEVDPGEFDVSGSVAVYSGVRVIGSGQSNTLLKHAGGASDFFVYTAAGSEYLYNIWVMDLAIRGGGKTTSDTLSAVRSDRNTDGLSIYGCGIARCLITNCYDGVGLENSWTFEVADSEFYDVGRNFIRGENLTAVKIKGNRMDVAGEDGLYLTFSTGASLETVALLLSQNVIQSCQRRGIYGLDCDHMMWDENYVENCNQAGGYPHVEFDSVSGTNAEMYSFVGGWASPSSNSGQPAFKIDKARMVSSHGTYIRGNNFSLGWELGSDVEGYAIDGDFNGGTFISVSGDTTGIAVNRLGLTLHGIDSETHTASSTSSNVNSSTSTRIQEINCTAGNRTYTLLDAHLQRGRRFTVQKTDGGSNQLIIAPSGTTNINGANASVNSTAAFARAEITCGFDAGTSTPAWFVKFI